MRGYNVPGGFINRFSTVNNLNLVLCDMASSSPRAISFFGVLQRIYSLFASSTKRWKILQDNVSKFYVKSLSQTRWESRIESVKAINFQESLGFRSDFRVLEVEETSSTSCNLSFSSKIYPLC